MFHKRLLREFPENRSLAAGMVVCQWISLLANVWFLIQTAKLIEAIYLGKQELLTPAKLCWYLIGAGVAFLVRGIATTVSSRLSHRATAMVKCSLRSRIYEKLLRLGVNYHEETPTSEVVQLSTEGVEQLEIYFGKYIPQFFYSLLAPLTLFFITGSMSLRPAVVLLICVPLIPISIVAVQKFAKRLLAKYWGTYTELGDSFLENLQGLTTLKIFGADDRYAVKMDEEAEKFRKITMRVLIMQLNSISVMDLAAYGGAAIGILLALLELKNGKIELAEGFFILMVSAEFFLPLRLLGSFFHIAMNGNAAADKIFRLLDREEPAEGTQKEPVSSELELKQIKFSYPGETESEVIKDISFTIKDKQFAALVGESGSGKSTISALLSGEYSPQQGEVTIGKTPVHLLSVRARNKKLVRIGHESYLFQGTVMDNLRMGKEDAVIAEMEAVLKQVDLYDFIMEHGGLCMMVEERASNFSGGQRQRLALARALLADSDIYIFDEATSNIDVESEERILNVIYELIGKKTILLISHRLANVKRAEQIFVLKDGQLAEQGTHKELLQKQGVYTRLYEQQSTLEQYRKINTELSA